MWAPLHQSSHSYQTPVAARYPRLADNALLPLLHTQVVMFWIVDSILMRKKHKPSTVVHFHRNQCNHQYDHVPSEDSDSSPSDCSVTMETRHSDSNVERHTCLSSILLLFISVFQYYSVMSTCEEPVNIIVASLSKPHTSRTALQDARVYLFACGHIP